MNNVLSFVEESCFSGDTFKSVRREIVFTLRGYGNQLGQVMNNDFRADFGLFYDYEDNYLREILADEFPLLKWENFVFHKKMDHSGIDIIETDTAKICGSIHVRRSSSLKLSSENLGATVMSWKQVLKWKEDRDLRRESQRKAEMPVAD